jgi:hypothetical protein
MGSGSLKGKNLYNFATYATIHFDEVLYDRYSMPYGFFCQDLIRFALLWNILS